MPNPDQRLKGLDVDQLRAEIDARAQPKTKGPAGAISLPAGDPGLADIETVALVGELRAKQKGIYEVDDRKDHFAIDDASVLATADSVAALFDAADVRDDGAGHSTLTVKSFKTEYNLCSNEAFASQPCGAFCSGFLVAKDIVATAGHCVDPGYLTAVDRVRFVFGFRMRDAFTAETKVPSADVYSGKALLGHVLTGTATDWALVRLDRAVVGRQPLKLRTSGRIADGAPVYVIGHPCGLPLKYAPGARVRKNAAPAFFSANLDTYGGNSGSPVFSEGHVVEGILVRGDTDFVTVGTCRRSAVFPTTGGQGEDVTRIEEILPRLPDN